MHPNTALTWVAQVGKHARCNPGGAALRYRGATTTWQQLDERSRRLATALEGRGVRAGDRVLLLLTNRPEFVEALVAVNRLGAIAVPVNFRLVEAEVAFLAENSGAGAVIVEEHLAPLVAGVRAQNSAVACLVVGEQAPAPAPGPKPTSPPSLPRTRTPAAGPPT